MNETLIGNEPAAGSQDLSLVRGARARSLRLPRLSWTTAAGLFLLAATLVHVGLVYRFPLAPDETYYWEWSRHPALGYYDQGPMVAWWIRATCLFFGETPLGIRFSIVLAALATQGLLWLLVRDLFGPRAAFLSLIPAAITPLALAGAFVATYDPLLVLFWAAAMYFAARALFFGSRGAWYAAGVSVGLGLLSKHTMVLFLPCLLLVLLTVPEQRVWLRRKEPWLAFLLAAAVFAPNLWWQTQHNWLTIHHLFFLTGKGIDHGFFRRLGDFVGSQAGLLTPILFFYMVGALVWIARTWREQRGPDGHGARLWFLWAMSVPVLLAFVVMTLRAKVQANWAVCGWLGPPIAAALWEEARRERAPVASGSRRATFSRGYAAALLFAAFLSLVLIFPELRPLMGVNVPFRWDQMNKLYGGRELGAAADAARAQMQRETGAPVAVGAVTYDTASRLAFYMAGKPHTCCLFVHTRLNSYVLWGGEGRPTPGGAMLIADDRALDDPQRAPFERLFQRVVPDPKPVDVYRPGVYHEAVRHYHLYRCYGYRPDPAVETPNGG